MFYRGFGPKALVSTGAHEAGAPPTVFLACNDEEVNPENCRKGLTSARAGLNGAKGRVEVVWYNGATRDFDDPGKSRQAVAANRQAKADSMTRAARIVESALPR